VTLEILRKRCLARLTSLPELLYALTRHWFLLTICLGVGTTIMVAKVLTDPVLFEGRATLAFNSSESILVAQERRGEGREDSSRFFSSRVEMLQSDSVMRKLVTELKPPNVLRQDQNTEALEYGPVRQAINDVKEKINSLLSYLEHPDILDQASDLELQKAINSFKRRSKVLPNPKTNNVELQLYASNRDEILKGLQVWIDAYTSRLVEMFEESRDLYINSRTKFWLKKEQEAHDALDTFKRENPEVSKSGPDLLLQQVFRLELRREDLQRELEYPTPKQPLVDDLPSKDPEVRSLIEQKRDLQRQLIRTTADFGENSDPAMGIKQSIALIDAKLLGRDQKGAVDPQEHRRLAQEQIEKLAGAIAEARKRHSDLSSLLELMQALESEYKRAQETHQNYKIMMIEEVDRSDLRRNVQVQVADRPTVDFQPFNTYPHRQVLYGSCGGAAVGIVIALLLEMLNGRVRFKNDIYTEFGIPVVGVIPRK